MIEHIAARLLASDADIDPECRFKLAGLARIGAADPMARGGDPYVRLSARGRVRLRRGADMQMFFAVFSTVLGIILAVGPIAADSRWSALPFLALGIALAVLALRTRHVDKRKYRARQQP